MSDWQAVPGLVRVEEGHGETTLVVDPARLVEACVHLRDEQGYDFLSDIAAADYLGWGDVGVSGYIGIGNTGIGSGRDLNRPMTQGLQVLPKAKEKRFSVSYHLLAVTTPPRRVRVQVWVEDGEAVPSVVETWPTADWHEREAWDLMGIPFADHPNLKRILTDDDWEGHPLRKDYPIGGEPVRFSEDS
jgi:NADH-quinone oxidoreductase subunit C